MAKHQFEGLLWEAALAGHEVLEHFLVDRHLSSWVMEASGPHAIANDYSYRNPTLLGLVAADGVRSDVEFVLSFGVDVNGRGVHDRTALWWAAKNGHTDVVKLLLDRGADVNAVDDEGRTALWQAGKDEHEDVMKLLRERGAV
ncbi:putative ankyrin repeat domain-containing protein 26-like protein [Escovopsis weberi]|uniref:Putative ankyrin repeat domain-containing protein 26-like protein n=1 Tax=Escovopsis weberi TaxID=150374 RepID=A0A0M9VWA6_ESCWE|nr:putative ankyrin repeat domain-containing protein 26-like protein [Escovopsis weberi]